MELKWFPGSTSLPSPTARVICFHGAGSDSTVFLMAGKSRPNCLAEFCKENDVELLAAHLPGRTRRHGESFVRSIDEAAKGVFEELRLILSDRKPYVVASHSMGCIWSYQTLLLVKAAGLPMPSEIFFASGLPCVGKPAPWNITSKMDDEAFRAECRAWSCNEEVFRQGIWDIYEPVLRADFHLFESFATRTSEILSTRITLASALRDARGTPEMLEDWRPFFAQSTVGVLEIDGSHAFVYDEAARRHWFQKAIIPALDRVLLEVEY